MTSADVTSGRVEILSEHLVYSGFLSVTEAELRYERYDGTMSARVHRQRMERGDSAAAVVVRLPERDIILVEQFKYPTRGWIVEVVAGEINPGESAEAAIRREITEEIGYAVNALEPISTFYVSPGGTSEKVMLFYAEVAEDARVNPGGGLPAEGEDIAVSVIPAAQLGAYLDSGRVHDAKTLVGLMWLRRRWES